MAAVGGISCTFVHGSKKVPHERVRAFSGAGYDGYGLHKMGTKNADFAFEAVLIDTPGNVATWADSVYALAGTIIAVVDDYGTTHTQMAPIDFGPLARRPWGLTLQRGSILIRGVGTAIS